MSTETDLVIKTGLLTATGEQRPCKVIVRQAELVITSRGILDIHIPMEWITALMFEDKSALEMSMAGFSIDYVDRCPARLMFFNTGLFPVQKTRNAVSTIASAHYNWSRGKLAPLKVIDVTALKTQAANSVVRR